MSILERRSATRVKALKKLVDKGEYPVEYAIGKLDDLNEKGLLTATDYEETFTYFEELLNAEDTAEETAENAENSAESEADNGR
jgi:hypothetical protein